MCGVTICFGGCNFFILFYLNITNRDNVMTTTEVVNPISLEDIHLFEDTKVNNPYEDIIKPIEENVTSQSDITILNKIKWS